MFDGIPDWFFDWYWALWLLLGFGLVEAAALLRKGEGDTLSEKVREWFATNRKPSGPAQMGRRVALVVALAWLVVHWLTNGSFV